MERTEYKDRDIVLVTRRRRTDWAISMGVHRVSSVLAAKESERDVDIFVAGSYWPRVSAKEKERRERNERGGGYVGIRGYTWLLDEEWPGSNNRGIRRN